MYVESLTVRNLRVFEEAHVTLQYPGRVLGSSERTLRLPNVNLILGNNGAGKSTLLKALALAALGPIGEKFPAYKLVRVTKKTQTVTSKTKKPSGKNALIAAAIDASLQLTWQDLEQKAPTPERRALDAHVEIQRRGDEEFVRFPAGSSDAWEPVFSTKSPAFLTVGYGATRRVDTDSAASTLEQRSRQMPLRQQRVQSLFSDHYPLVSLTHWLPELRRRNPGRFVQVRDRLSEVLPEGYEFTTDTDASGDYLFRQGQAVVPFPALSDGCRAFVGWVADLLYHICMGAPSGVKLSENCGLVLVDEIDLHLHPEWQRTVIPRLAKTFPNLQFVFTSHSPIVVGSLERDNLWVSEVDPQSGVSTASQKDIGVHGLNADQILLTDYFGLKTSRAKSKEQQLTVIAEQAERGVPQKAQAFLTALVTSLEDEEQTTKAVERNQVPVKKRRRR